MRKITSILALMVGVLLCGCATAGYQRASLARDEVVEARTVTVKAHQQLVVAVRAVHDLTAKETTGLQAPYQVFAASVRGLDVSVAQLADRVEAIRKRSDAYVLAWQKDLGAFHGDDLRKLSAERRTEVIESFRTLNAEFQICHGSLRSLLVALKDMRLYLSIDLTGSGVAVVQEQSGRISAQAAEAGEHLQSFAAYLDRVAAEMFPGKIAAEEPASPAPPPPKDAAQASSSKPK
jgi:hypothetical protein